MIPPRIHVLRARDAPYAVIVRRGPSKHVALIGWDMRDDTFRLGQWLKGRIYERRSDISPDGRYLIYFAMNGRWNDASSGSWTAISRAPYLTALHFYGWGDCWNGGGLFASNVCYWLNGERPDEKRKFLDCGLQRQAQPPNGIVPQMGEDTVTYFPKLERDGWFTTGKSREASDDIWDFHKPATQGWTLQKRFHAGFGSGPLGRSYWETHSLTSEFDRVDGTSWEWADVCGDTVVYASGGALWRLQIENGEVGRPVMVKDFSEMTFERREAPYDGLRIGEMP